MNLIELNQKEADVVIVLCNPAVGRMELHPFWECDPSLDVPQFAADLALKFVESCGAGHVQVELFDWRKLPQIAEGSAAKTLLRMTETGDFGIDS